MGEWSHQLAVEWEFSALTATALMVKHAIVGSFHQVSTKHFDRYLDESAFRYNNRKNTCLFRDTLIA